MKVVYWLALENLPPTKYRWAIWRYCDEQRKQRRERKVEAESYMVYVNCMTHRLALCTSNAGNDTPIMLLLSIKEDISTKEDINHVVKAVLPVAVVVHVFRIFNPTKRSQPHCDGRETHKWVTCFKCNQDGHIVKNCPYNNKQYNSRRKSSSIAELEGTPMISSTMNRSDKWLTRKLKSIWQILEAFCRIVSSRIS